jgi:GrpB-like predicted nucleotidyltransferase (UPF0157 family)
MTEVYERWSEGAQQEQTRLLAALGGIIQGGVIENIQQIGATSVVGLPAKSVIDLVLAIIPFPVEETVLAMLESLGYRALSPQINAHELRFVHTSGHFQLFISEPGSDEWMNHLLIRDYLRHDEEARQRYGRGKPEEERPESAEVKEALFAGLLAKAKQWWVDFHGWRPLEFVCGELEGYDPPWYISSGWALDLFLGRVTRVHQDVDVVVARADQLALRAQMSGRGWEFVTPLEGKLEPWPLHTRLELPRIQVHAHREGHFIDFLLTEMTTEVWRYRRKPEIIRRIEQAGRRTEAGIPYLAPELVLLFKSRNTGKRERGKDQRDFEEVYPHLDAEARAWLRWALIATEPTHAWIELLG